MSHSSNADMLRVVIAQLNFTVGDIINNTNKHIANAIIARDELGADIIVFPELSVTGYPAEDLLLRTDFLQAASNAIERCRKEITGIYCVINYPKHTEEGLLNCSAIIYNGKIIDTYAKMRLPNYGVFDENRYFINGTQPCVVNIKGVDVGFVICEDLWFKTPVELTCFAGAKLIIAPNASPFEINKHKARKNILRRRAQKNNVPIIYVNSVGGQDELVFDGGSQVVDASGNVCQFAGYFNEALVPVDFKIKNGALEPIKTDIAPEPSVEEKVYQALVTAVRDYTNKNHFKGVLLGVSGGIDSALTLAIAVDALGKDRVKAIVMPSRHTADISLQDADELINRLGVAHETISIEASYQAFIETLAPVFKDAKMDKTEENIQARCRAVILMAISNKYGWMVLTTGNRSEVAVGYCTLYGDMAGGFDVLKDIPKTTVYALANYRNKVSHVIPLRTIERPPTAELAPDQKDQDSLPPYPILDSILDYYLNQGESIDQITQRGFDHDEVIRVVRLMQNCEYKRRQAAIGPRVNEKSFGKDWRYPLTNGFKI